MARKWWTLIVVCAATFMLLLDITVVNTALPDIENDLGASFADLQWVIDAYALTLAAFTLMAGSLADLLGRKRVFLVGIVIFTVASLLCALAGSPTLLNVARALQGVGGAVMFAVSLALLAQDFRGRELATATAVFGATIGAAVAIGPLVGGALTDTFGWESIFYLNLPIGILAVFVTQAKVRESRDPQPRPIDWIGVVTFSVALFLLVLALLRGNTVGWGSTEIVVMFIAAAGFLAGFIASQALGREPMLPLSLFRRPAFVGVQLAAFSISASMFALFLYLTLYLQNVLGFSPFDTGLRYLPITLASFIVAGAAGGTLNRIPARFLIAAGLAMVGGGLFLMSGLEPSSEWTALLAGFILSGRGRGPGERRGDGDRAPGRAARAGGHGVGDQQHVPPGRDRDRDGGARRDLPEPLGRRDPLAARWDAGGDGRAADAAHRGRLLGQPRQGARADPAAAAGAGHGRRHGGLPHRSQRDPRDRRRRVLRRGACSRSCSCARRTSSRSLRRARARTRRSRSRRADARTR